MEKTLVLQISTATENTEGYPIEKVACDLNYKFPDESKIDAYIYDDKQSSRRLAIGFEDQRRHGDFLWHLHARYLLDRNRKKQTLVYLVPIENQKDGLLDLERATVFLAP